MMERRKMLTVSGTAFAAMSLSLSATAQDKAGSQSKELIELRTYSFDSVKKHSDFVVFMKDAMIPALNKIGIDRIGVFENVDTKDLNLYVVLPHRTLESFTSSTRRIMADRTFREAGKEVLESTKKNPAFKRIETQLTISFDAVPKLEEPAEKNPDRLFQLRIYESHNTERALKKIEMFNEGGEVKLFRKYGMNPIFFGESIAGTRIPNLTYMITFKDEEAKKQAWNAFKNSPGWKKLSRDPIYKDTVCNITNKVLKPTQASQL